METVLKQCREESPISHGKVQSQVDTRDQEKPATVTGVIYTYCLT